MRREIQTCGSTKIDVMDNFKRTSSISYINKETSEIDSLLLLLPDEILLFILSHLKTVTDFVRVSETCHRLNVLATDNQLWYPLINHHHTKNALMIWRRQSAVVTLDLDTGAFPQWFDQSQESQPDILTAHPSVITGARPSRRLYAQIARRIGAKSAIELSCRLSKHVDVNVWRDMCVELNQELSLTCEIRSPSNRLLAASLNSLIRRVVSLEDPWSTLPEDNITLFCALQTLLPQKLILKKLVEVVTINPHSLHGFSPALTSIDLLLANRGVLPLAAESRGSPKWPLHVAARVCSVCGRNVNVSSSCIAKDNVADIKQYVQLRVATLVDFWIMNYGDLLEETNSLLDLQVALKLPCWLPNIPTKSLIAKAREKMQQQRLPPYSQLEDFVYLCDTTKSVKDTAIRLTKDDLEVYRCIPNIELQRAALWSDEKQPYRMIISRLPYLGRVDHRARCLTEYVVTHMKSLKSPSKLGKKPAAASMANTQASCIHHCIGICSALHELKNFVSLRALIVAIHSCIADPTVNISWKMVSYQDFKTYQKLEQLVTPSGGAYGACASSVWGERYTPNSINCLQSFLSNTDHHPHPTTPPASISERQQSDIAGIPIQHLISSDTRRTVFPLHPINTHLKAARTMIELKPLMPTK
ncbi:uncharacterized protein LOC134179581 [Corticium candelabrum]|uniref:uncharacterized protein LOC134179581 n=1 Tax=Corticium candelabrum TaxID=121492 RepID=UPI002E27066D|nr:uncharacterized protein LOC134179581 [Corticium candelabrum]